MTSRTRAIVVSLLVVFAVGGIGAGLVIGAAFQPTQEGQYERLRMQVEDNARRIGRLEDVKDSAADFRARLAVLEDNMFELKWLSRTVAGALVLQLVSPVLLRRRNGVAAV